ncbi:PAS domain-containing protein [Natrinema amylolyticum]|uniref:PAS domain-containing protein n=1 Tax=Natrinema amylolyticum TaxID=2878679 RepID=UPI001CFA42E3|nr:PAS domain-containing protein [Natrinema amylolyticum]
MLTLPTAVSEPAVRLRPTRLTVSVVGEDGIRDRIERAFADDEIEITVEVAPTLADAVADRETDAADCLVLSSPPAATADAETPVQTDVETLDERLETVRAAAPDLPVVVLADERTPELADAVRSYDWTVVIERDETRARLADRVSDLLERHRLTALSRRSLASVEFAGDGVAIVDPDGEIQFASRSFAMQFGYEHDALHGVSWRDLFTDDAVERLESTAIPTIAEGWRWTGTCTGRRTTGATFAARVQFGGLEDGSLVVVVDEAEESSGLED